jgi:hypothetical protein
LEAKGTNEVLVLGENEYVTVYSLKKEARDMPETLMLEVFSDYV